MWLKAEAGKVVLAQARVGRRGGVPRFVVRPARRRLGTKGKSHRYTWACPCEVAGEYYNQGKLKKTDTEYLALPSQGLFFSPLPPFQTRAGKFSFPSVDATRASSIIWCAVEAHERLPGRGPGSRECGFRLVTYARAGNQQ